MQSDVEVEADWQRRVVGRSLRNAAERSVDRGKTLIEATFTVLARSNGEDITVQEVADEAGQSLRTLYQYFESKDDLLLAVFEEAMRDYAAMIRQAIAELDDPLDRLIGAVIAAARMPEFTGTGVDRGLARLRLKLSEVQPELIGRSQLGLTTLVRELLDAAATAGAISISDPEEATFLLLSSNAAFITAGMLGNDAGVRRPEVRELAAFCLRGLGATLTGDWYDAVERRLTFPSRPARKRAARKS